MIAALKGRNPRIMEHRHSSCWVVRFSWDIAACVALEFMIPAMQL
jgi:hypothetical protein